VLVFFGGVCTFWLRFYFSLSGWFLKACILDEFFFFLILKFKSQAKRLVWAVELPVEGRGLSHRI
jgi:hypothetical protein